MIKLGFKKNSELKLLSILIALIVCFYAYKKEETARLPLVVPVRIANLPENKVILLPSNLQAQISLKGSTSTLSSVIKANRYFEARLPNDVSNRYKLVLSAEDIELPTGVEVLSIEPAEIELIMDDLVTKTVPVEVTRLGKMDDSVRIVSQYISPSRVEINGPSTEVKEVTRVETYPLDLREVKSSIQTELELRSPGKFSKLNVKKVKIEMMIEGIKTERVFKDVNIEIRGGQNIATKPSKVFIAVTGQEDLIENVKPESIKAYIDIKNGSAKDEIYEVKVELPEGLELVMLTPKTVIVGR